MRAIALPRIGAHTHRMTGGTWVQTLYVLADLFFIVLNGTLVFRLRYPSARLLGLAERPFAGSEHSFPYGPYLGFLILYAALILLLAQSQNLYRAVRARTSAEESLAVARAVMGATLLLVVFIYLSNVKVISRLVVGCSAVLNVLTLAAWRLWRRNLIERRALRGVGTRNVLIVGAETVGLELARYFEEHSRLGFVVRGFLDQNHSTDPRLRGRIEDFARVAREEFVEEVFITTPSDREVVRTIALEARHRHINVRLIPESYDGLAWRAPLEYVGDFPAFSLHREPIPVLGVLLKRSLDVAVACFALVALSPLLAAIAVAIKLDSPGPVLFPSLRVGKKGRRFICYKFRSMVPNADTLKDQLRHLNERCGPTFKIAHDPRISRVGRYLRKYSLDELPQLWNVLKGNMSLVGPRPHPTDDCAQYTLEHLRRLDVTPGITGLWQVSARRDPAFEKNLALDIEYIDNWNFWLDLKILLRTLPAVVNGNGQ